jgi:type IV pilus assembly protein PilF
VRKDPRDAAHPLTRTSIQVGAETPVDETVARGVLPKRLNRVALLRLFHASSYFFPQVGLVALGFTALQCLGCEDRGPVAPNVSPERRSETEYDVARDYFFKAQPRLALDHIHNAVRFDPDNAKALYFASAIHLFFCSGKLELLDPDCRLADAEDYVRRALKSDPNFREAKNTLGQVLILEKRFAEAIDVLAPLTKDPSFESSYLAWGNLGWAQTLSGQTDQGIESLKNSITEPRFCVGHYRLGVAYQMKGDLADAELSFTSAVTVDAPECKGLQDAWAARGTVRTRLGKPADARSDFEKCRDLSPDTLTGKTCVAALDALARMQ